MRDRVRVGGRIEVHSEGVYYLEWREEGRRLRAAIPHAAEVLERARLKSLELEARQTGIALDAFRPEVRTESLAALPHDERFPGVTIEPPSTSNAARLLLTGIEAYIQERVEAALRNLQEGNIAPVDLAQAAIGPGMAVYTRYAKVLDAEGNALTVKQALALINDKLDAVLAELEGDFDADTRWALAWFDQAGFAEGEYGVAETLSKAKNTSVQGMVDAKILVTKAGKVRLLRPEELAEDWNPETETRLTEWEIVHQLIRALNAGGETAAAELVARLDSRADTARELAYRLYVLCERKKRAQEALAYNALVQSWPEIQRLAAEQGSRSAAPEQTNMFG